MPYNGSGTFDPLPPPDFPAVSGSTINSAYFNNLILDIINQGLSRAVVRDGQAAMTGNLNLGGNKIINLGAPTASSDAVTKGYLEGLPPWAVSQGGTGAATFSPNALIKGNGTNPLSPSIITDNGFSVNVSGRLTAISSSFAVQASNGGGAGQTSIAITRAGGPLDQKTWEILQDGAGALSVRTVNDGYSNSETAISIARGSGVSVDSVAIWAGASPRIFVTSGGFVGINNTSPTRSLDVIGNAAITGTLSAGSLAQSTEVAASGTATATSVGHRGIPVVITSGKTLELSDQGKDIYTSGNITIPANSSVAFPEGAALTISNSTASPITISINTDTLRWNSNTGTRTLAAYGTANLHKKTSTLWWIKGDVS